MARNLYSPRLSDDVVRSLYREGKRRHLPMTRLADELLRQALGTFTCIPSVGSTSDSVLQADPPQTTRPRHDHHPSCSNATRMHLE
ncbi:hypothetical protein HNR46_004100 [Haloferula luteola]|uniref:Uncharacterized protein n=1 Tax=Haloferula luteola TaxID=595692 RepID=A0A840V9S8_9BACT|nr:hypothetical protein [Haloferula luteola]MBB5353836.1 hypothetical protein [Haloferula luteola]